MTHFSTLDTLLKRFWRLWSVTADTFLRLTLCCALATVCPVLFLLDHKADHFENFHRIDFLSFTPHVFVVDGSAWMCVGERGGECRLGMWPDSPLFGTYHAKVLLIRLIKCFVGTGPTLPAINTSSITTPTPPLHRFIFHMLGFLSPFIITLEKLATFSLTVCQRMFLPAHSTEIWH